jgi:hypothetical protein
MGLVCAWVAVRARGEDTPSGPKFSEGDDEEEDEDEEEREVTPPPHSLPPKDLASFGDLFSQQTGISVGARWSKQPRAKIEPSTGLSPQFDHALVHSDLQGMNVAIVVTGIAHLLGVW